MPVVPLSTVRGAMQLRGGLGDLAILAKREPVTFAALVRAGAVPGVGVEDLGGFFSDLVGGATKLATGGLTGGVKGAVTGLLTAGPKGMIVGAAAGAAKANAETVGRWIKGAAGGKPKGKKEKVRALLKKPEVRDKIVARVARKIEAARPSAPARRRGGFPIWAAAAPLLFFL